MLVVLFSYLLLHRRTDETQPGRNSCPRLHFGFQFGLYRVVVALSVYVVSALFTLFMQIKLLFVVVKAEKKPCMI